MKRYLARARDWAYLLVTAKPADARHYWTMRLDREQGARQFPVPVSTARELTAMLGPQDRAVVFGSAGSVAALVAAGCDVTHVESDPGRAYGAEYLLAPGMRARLTSLVIDRGHVQGRQQYAHAFIDLAAGTRLVVVAGRSRSKVSECVAEHAHPGTRLVVVRGDRSKYRQLRDGLASAGKKCRIDRGPAADGSSVRTSALVVQL